MIGLSRIVASVTRPLGQLGRAAFRFVFPPSCPRCHTDLEPSLTDTAGRLIAPILCGRCAGELSSERGNRCQRCGMPLGPYLHSDHGCAHCHSRKFQFARVIRMGLYKDALRAACIRAKSATQSPLGAALANQLWFSERDDFDAFVIDLIVPVPQFWTRRLARPHHAAETLARVLANRMRRPHSRTLLHKIRFTPDQSDLPAAHRRLNLRNAFSVWFRPASLVGKTVLLVDDILTTGTTANECARVLRRAGAKQVFVAVIAVVPPASR